MKPWLACGFGRLAIAATLAALLAGGNAFLSGPPVAAASSCSEWLSPREVVGYPWWVEHRHWLEMSRPFNGRNYTIINMSTYQSFHWAFWGNNPNGQFGVSSWYADWNPRWVVNGWLIVYEC